MLKSLAALVGSVLSISFSAHAADWWSVQENEIRKTSCASLQAPTQNAMQMYLQAQMNPSEKISVQSHGVQFVDENPLLINLFEKIHEKWNNEIQFNDVKCDKVVCVLDKVYGKKMSLPMLYIMAKFGLTTSRHAALTPDNYQNWTLSQLNVVLAALEALPPNVLPLKQKRHILHFKKGYTLASYGDDGGFVLANARIDIFDGWDGKSRLEQIAIIMHELGHVLGSKLDDSAEWKAMPPTRLSEYGKTNHAEDFAESFIAYRIAPNKLRSLHPERYSYIKKNVFGGLEFKNNGDCEEPFKIADAKIANTLNVRREIQTWADNNSINIQNEVHRQSQIVSFRKDLWNVCGKVYLNEITGGSRDATEQCIANVIIKRSYVVQTLSDNRDEYLKGSFTPEIKNVSVQRKKLGLMRQYLKLQATDNMEKIYELARFEFMDTAADCKDRVDMLQYVSDLQGEFASQTEGGKKVLLKACEQQVTSIWKKMFGPDFSRILP